MLLALILMAASAAAQPCDAELGNFYRALNADYFGGSLGEACIRYKPGMLEHAREATTERVYVDTKPVYLISLDIRLKPLYNDSRMSVIHEACHVKNYGELEMHGPKWRNCMRYLAAAGAMDSVW